jgi:hypothetical protein
MGDDSDPNVNPNDLSDSEDDSGKFHFLNILLYNLLCT